MSKFTLAALALIAAVAAPLCISVAQAHSYRVGTITIDHPWAPATRTGTPVGVAYMTISNAAPVPVLLLGVSSPIADKVEIHSMSMDGGIMRMRPVAGGVTIPARGKISFGPSGLHMMLLGLRKTLEVEEMEPMTLTFRGGLTIKVDLYIETSPMGGGHQH
ncbi:MAG: copper chaperone PCu(A)C [Micropepsaceae bacterium]